MGKACRAVLWLFGAAYLFALAILAIGIWGRLGPQSDSLSDVFLVLLGLPWTLFGGGAAVALFTPLVNGAILWQICRWRRGRR